MYNSPCTLSFSENGKVLITRKDIRYMRDATLGSVEATFQFRIREFLHEV